MLKPLIASLLLLFASAPARAQDPSARRPRHRSRRDTWRA